MQWLDKIVRQFGLTARDVREAVYETSGRDPRYTREILAEDMRALGFRSWRGTTLAKIEYLEREIKLDEAVALCELLGVNLVEMIKPTNGKKRGR